MSKSLLDQFCDIEDYTDDELLWVEFTIDLRLSGVSSFDLVRLIGEMDRRSHEFFEWVTERGYKVCKENSCKWYVRGNVLTWSLVLDVHLESLRRKGLLQDKLDEMRDSIQ